MSDCRIAGVIPESIVDGPGLRYVVFFQGCYRACKGCHNPETWDTKGGKHATTEDLIRGFSDNPLLEGITLSGGEPFLQPGAALELAKAAKRIGLTVWCWTGYRLEALYSLADPVTDELLEYIDVLVDGKFEIDQKSMDLPWRGSKNQRIIHLTEHTKR